MAEQTPRKNEDGARESLTQILKAASAGDSAAAESLLSLVYDELRELAAARLRRASPNHTLQPTVLVHEVYLRLFGKQGADFANRQHFFFAASRAMKCILVDHARRKLTLKRGGDREQVSLDIADVRIEAPADDVLAVGDALDALEQVDPIGAKLVLLRYFGGLEMSEIGEVLDMPARTLERKWQFVRAWLRSRVS